MWSTIDRARRLLGGGPSIFDAAVDGRSVSIGRSSSTPPAASGPTEDVTIVLGTAELDHLRVALETELGDAVERPDTPARIERALALWLARDDAPGTPSVLRRPAGLSTPESWEIHLDGVEGASAIVVREAGRTGVLAS